MNILREIFEPLTGAVLGIALMSLFVGIILATLALLAFLVTLFI